MTDEANGYNSEDAPARPASTRWSEDSFQDEASRDDDGLTPPYVPGRRTSTAAPSASTPSTPPAPSTSDDDFPFDTFDIDGDGGLTAPEDAADGFGSGSDEMVWSPDDLEDAEEPFGQGAPEYGEESAVEESAFGEERYGEWTPPYEDEDDRSAVDAELEPITDESPVEEVEAAAGEPEHRFEPDGSIESGADERVEEVAAVLDRLAGLLREEGEDAVRREMESQDRLTALVSSLLSGHLSARQ